VQVALAVALGLAALPAEAADDPGGHRRPALDPELVDGPRLCHVLVEELGLVSAAQAFPEVLEGALEELLRLGLQVFERRGPGLRLVRAAREKVSQSGVL
jgi:hypothetical protein